MWPQWGMGFLTQRRRAAEERRETKPLRLTSVTSPKSRLRRYHRNLGAALASPYGEVQRTVAAFRGKPRTRHSSADHLRWRTQPLGHGSPPFRRDTEIRGNAPEWLELETWRLPSSHFPWSAARPQAQVIRIESLATTRTGGCVENPPVESGARPRPGRLGR